MSEPYEHLPLYQRFHQACRSRGIRLEPEWGGWVLYQGRPWLIAAVEGPSLALVDDLAGIPLDERQILYVTSAEEDPACVFLPAVEFLLQFIFERTGFFPAMTPGIQAAREVWQLTHPHTPPIVCSSLRGGLVELAVRLVESPPLE